MASGAGGVGGGGGGGGKIRARRCHQGPVKPYQQGRQQHQGILSRVTESVKNIVPGWLQRYFNKNEDVCSCSTDTAEIPQWPENRENDHLIYANEESSNIHDGRITPEPTVSNTEEPSTTSTASNYPDVLTRPSLHRSHMTFSVLESPALRCQPSTSSTFPIGSSGFSLVKEIKDSTSQHDDDNISTTSGFSSRASDKDIAVSKNTSVPPLWYPEAERSHSLSQHTATSLKKPAFSLSAFGTPSPSLGNPSILKTSQLGDSPFYPGKTTYGGAAAAVRQSQPRNTPYQAPVRRQMKAKQLSAQSYGVTSSTARRILQSLEKMSSPLEDAKRIPSIVSSPLFSPFDSSGLGITMDFQAKREKVDSQYPPVQRLMTPKPVSIATNRTVYFKPSLTPSGELRKTNQRIDKKHSAGYEKNMTPVRNIEQESGFSYPNFSMSAANGLSSGVGSGGGKMRRERTRFVASKPPQEEEMEVPVLPKISLPITSASLPTFSFSSSVVTTSSPSPISPLPSTTTNKVQTASPNSTGSPMFRFSSPIVKSTEADVLPPSSIGFTFSVPVAKTTELPDSSSISEPITSSSAQDNTVVNSTSCRKTPDEDGESLCRPAEILKEGSVLDVLKNPGFASPKAESLAAQPATTSPVVYTRPAISSFSSSGTGFGESFRAESWQCDTCLLQNKVTDSKCAACQATKLPPKDTVKQTGIGTPSKSGKSALSASGTGFGDKFKPAVGTWDCDTCLVQNKSEAIKCVACETPKPGTGVQRVLTLTAASESAVTVAASTSSCAVTTGTLGFADKFKQPVGSWECPVCCVFNNADDSKCVSCMSEKPGSPIPASVSSTVPVSLSPRGCLGLEKAKEPEGSCEVGLVQNKVDSTKCVASEAAKPGTGPEFKDQGATKPVFSFLNNRSSISSTPTTSAGGGLFGGSTSSSSAPVAAFVFGQAGSLGSSSAFGSPAEASASQPLLFCQESKPVVTSSTGAAVSPFVFGPGAGGSGAAATGFSFGGTATTSTAGSSFVFGTGTSVLSSSPAFGANQTPTFGQSQGASQPNPSGFGSIPSSAALFSAGSQPVPAAFGTVSGGSQPPVFGQQPSQPGFGSAAAPNSGSVFQFGSSATNFNFTNNSPSGVFTFGANPGTAASSAQPSGSGGFPFSQAPAAFVAGSNGKNMFSASSGTSVSGRKIKTAVRRRK
ncbi:nuclear pore complex protein Nup153 isoform X4 [Manis pentadactyla]|uniref:nuclear pore complex protein Nup153 isoform X4 n=1 Tax=Manis pentadactyla TaxID=143292 RepID=UPI00255C9F1E|nr:nuclear pore complex protein Nup153 isoform X4 [Manis pentadactyla]